MGKKVVLNMCKVWLQFFSQAFKGPKKKVMKCFSGKGEIGIFSKDLGYIFIGKISWKLRSFRILRIAHQMNVSFDLFIFSSLFFSFSSIMVNFIHLTKKLNHFFIHFQPFHLIFHPWCNFNFQLFSITQIFHPSCDLPQFCIYFTTLHNLIVGELLK